MSESPEDKMQEAVEAETQEQEQTPARELPGRQLRETREAGHLSREEVAHHLRLDPSLIKALEEDDYKRLPSPAYICGYLRSYARLLKLNETEIVNAYSNGQEISSALVPENIKITPQKRINYGPVKLIIGLLLIVMLIGAGFWLLEQLDTVTQFTGEKEKTTIDAPLPLLSEPAGEAEAVPPEIEAAVQSAKQSGPDTLSAQETQATEQTATVSESAVSSAEQEQSSAPAEAAQVKSQSETSPVLRLYYRDDSWTEIMDGEGNRVVYRLVKQGDELEIDAPAPYTILLGNAPAVDVYYKNNRFDHTRFHRNEIAYFRIGYK